MRSMSAGMLNTWGGWHRWQRWEPWGDTAFVLILVVRLVLELRVIILAATFRKRVILQDTRYLVCSSDGAVEDGAVKVRKDLATDSEEVGKLKLGEVIKALELKKGKKKITVSGQQKEIPVTHIRFEAKVPKKADIKLFAKPGDAHKLDRSTKGWVTTKDGDGTALLRQVKRSRCAWLAEIGSHEEECRGRQRLVILWQRFDWVYTSPQGVSR